MVYFYCEFLKNYQQMLAKSLLKKKWALNNDHRINLISDQTILPAINDCVRDYACTEMTKQILKSFCQICKQ